VGSLNGRVSRLEGRISTSEAEPPEDPGAALRKQLLRATLKELARLKASRARYMRGGKYVEPEDIPGQYLTKPHTTGQLVELAIRLVWEREELDEDLMDSWVQGFEELLSVRLGFDLERIEDDGT
jgi:hypothetical protein